FALPSVGVECDGTVRVQIVSLAVVAVPIGRGIACSPDDQVLFRIKRTGNPGRRSTRLPRITGPGLAAGFAGRGDRPVSPAALARSGVVGIEKASDAVLAAADAA